MIKISALQDRANFASNSRVDSKRLKNSLQAAKNNCQIHYR